MLKYLYQVKSIDKSVDEEFYGNDASLADALVFASANADKGTYIAMFHLDNDGIVDYDKGRVIIWCAPGILEEVN